MQFNIEIKKRHLFIILSVIIFLAGVILVIAINPTTKPNPGHASDEVMVNIPGVGDKILQQAIDDGDFDKGRTFTNCGWTGLVCAGRPYWATATCPGGKFLAGWNCYWSKNTEENEEILVVPIGISCRYRNAGSIACANAYCCDI